MQESQKLKPFLAKIQLIFLILIIGLSVYFNSFFNGFVWDDEEQILNNSIIKNFSNLPLIFKSSTFSTGGAGLSGLYYKPLMSFSFMVNYLIWQSSPFGFHLFQVILHLINAVFVFLIFSKFFKNTFVSFFLSLIFTVHPVNTESVSYISAVQEVLFTFFTLLAFLILLYFKNKKPLIISALLIFLGLLSKETALLSIVIFLFYFIIFEKERIVSWILFSFIIILNYLFLRIGIAKLPFSHSSFAPISEATFFQRFLTIPWEIIYYFRVLFFPKTLTIAQHTVIKNPADFSFWGYGILTLIFIAGIIWIALKLKSKNFYFFLFWFFCSLSLILNIFPLDMTVAERWLYFPMIGFLGMAGVIIEKLNIKNKKIKTFGMIFAFIIIFTFSIRTILRNFDWKNGLTLYRRDVINNPTAFDLQNNYGVELFRIGKVDEAKKHFEKSIVLAPKWWTSYNNLGAVYERKGDLKQAEKLYRQAIKNSDYYLAYENLGFLLLKTNQIKEAVSFLEKAILKFPQNSRLKVALSLAYYKENRQEEALMMAKQAFYLEPTIQNKNLIELIMSQKRVDF
ncbi:MAG: tetratricopeptide repeat protein [Microgenomates group bacterium]